MKPEMSFPSFKLFKSLLFSALSESGFQASKDIAVKDLSGDVQAQVVLAGNAYYLAITLQIALPSAANELAREFSNRGVKKRFNSGKVFNPVLSADAFSVIGKSDLKEASDNAEWSILCSHTQDLAEAINNAYCKADIGTSLPKPPWWPDRLSDDQLAMLLIGARNTGSPELKTYLEQRYRSD